MITLAESPSDPYDIPQTTDLVERSLLGSLLILGSVAVSKVTRVVSADDFVGDSNRAIFNAIVRVHGEGASPDLVLVAADLEDARDLERAGGAAYLSMLVDRIPDVENVVFYAKVIRVRAIERRSMRRSMTRSVR